MLRRFVTFFLISIGLVLLTFILIFIFIPSEKTEKITPVAKANEVKIPVQSSSNNLKKKLFQLKLQDSTHLKAGFGAKSVCIDSKGEKVFTLNLEVMSVFGFDRKNRKKTDEFIFKATPAKGYDYNNHTAIASFEEKPVEACFTHGDSILWVSLHNAGGIVPLPINPISFDKSSKTKLLTHKQGVKSKKFEIPFIPTGLTPKSMAVTSDNQWLLVSNWHSKTISALQLNYARNIPTIQHTLKTGSIPRGIAIDDSTKIAYIAEMGGDRILRWNLNNFEELTPIKVKNNPRHIVLHRNQLFCSFNKLNSIGCYDTTSGSELFRTSTKSQPRTIAVSQNGQFVFVCCYSGQAVQVFEVKEKSFEKKFDFRCYGDPVGLAIFEDEITIDLWVCTYRNGRLYNYRFKKV